MYHPPVPGRRFQHHHLATCHPTDGAAPPEGRPAAPGGLRDRVPDPPSTVQGAGVSPLRSCRAAAPTPGAATASNVPGDCYRLGPFCSHPGLHPYCRAIRVSSTGGPAADTMPCAVGIGTLPWRCVYRANRPLPRSAVSMRIPPERTLPNIAATLAGAPHSPAPAFHLAARHDDRICRPPLHRRRPDDLA